MQLTDHQKAIQKLIHNAKINRVTYLVTGCMFMFYGLFSPFCIGIGAVLLFSAYATNQRYKELSDKYNSKPEPKPVEKSEPFSYANNVKVTELNGNVTEIKDCMKLDDDTIVLTTPSSKSYHTCIGCYKKWRPEMVKDFTGWTIIKKEDAIKQGMTYCKFCLESDNYTIDDLVNDMEDLLKDEEER